MYYHRVCEDYIYDVNAGLAAMCFLCVFLCVRSGLCVTVCDRLFAVCLCVLCVCDCLLSVSVHVLVVSVCSPPPCVCVCVCLHIICIESSVDTVIPRDFDELRLRIVPQIRL